MFNSKVYKEEVEIMLKRLEEEYIERRNAMREILRLCSIQTYPKNIIIIETFDQENKQWIVETNATKDQLKWLDLRYGMKSRFENTCLQQMIDGAKQEGYIFNVVKERAAKGNFSIDSENAYYLGTGNY